MEKKYGVYICKGCGIKDAIDVEKVAGAAKKVQNYKFHDVLCSPEGVQLIKDDIAKEGINTIVIAACSPRVKYEEFSFAGALVERVNIREFVAWTLEPNTDEANDAAYDYLSMGIVKAHPRDRRRRGGHDCRPLGRQCRPEGGPRGERGPARRFREQALQEDPNGHLLQTAAHRGHGHHQDRERCHEQS
jgi:hypothetical protein